MAISSSWSGTPIQGSGSPLTPTQYKNQQVDAWGQPIQGTGAAIPDARQQAATGALGGAQGYAGQAAQSGQGAIAAAYANSAPIQAQASGLGSLGNSVSSEFSGNAGMADKALQQAFDPMKAQETAGLAATQDATGAALAGSGLASTPYGASVLAGSAGNFENNWQTQQIARENTGAQSAAALQGSQLSAQSTGGQLMNAAGQLDQGAMSSILSSYGLSEQGSAAAAQTLASIFGSLGISQTSSLS